MSDEDIRAARLWAGEEFQKTLERARKEAADRVQRFAAQQKFCEDIVYKTRNPAACSWPLNWPHLGEPTIDMTESQLFESRLLGICALLETAKEARENDCLPKAEQ